MSLITILYSPLSLTDIVTTVNWLVAGQPGDRR